MHWLALLAAFIALILARTLRAPRKSKRVTGLIFFTASLLVTVFAIRTASESNWVTRPTDYDRFVVHAAEQVTADPQAPLVVFVGASFSRNALDDQKLTKLLRERGYPHRAINLSLQGASLQERHAHLWQFMTLTKRAPDVVFFEVAEEFDADPAYVFRVAKFSDRAIEQFSPNAVYWSMKGLSQGECEGLKACVQSWVLLKVHAAMNWSNLGLLSTGEAAPKLAPVPACDPQSEPRETFDLPLNEIVASLASEPQLEAAVGPAWARLFRADQRKGLEEIGVRRVAYYSPPVVPAHERAYVAALCEGELASFECIAPVDRTLLQALSGPVWFDEKHLLADGAAVYTDWLARQIDAGGALK